MIKYTTESGAVYWVDTENKCWQRTGQSDEGLTKPNDVWHEYDWFRTGESLVFGCHGTEMRVTTDIVSKEEVWIT